MTLLKSATTGDLGLRHELWEHVRAQKELSLEELQAALAGLVPEGHTLVAASEEDVVTATAAALP